MWGLMVNWSTGILVVLQTVVAPQGEPLTRPGWIAWARVRGTVATIRVYQTHPVIVASHRKEPLTSPHPVRLLMGVPLVGVPLVGALLVRVRVARR